MVVEFSVQYSPNIAATDFVARSDSPAERLNSIMDSTASARQNLALISQTSPVPYAGKPKRTFRKRGPVHPDVTLCRRKRGVSEHLRNCWRVHPARRQHSSKRPPKCMKTKLWRVDPGPLTHLGKDPGDGAAADPSVRRARPQEDFTASTFRPPVEDVVPHGIAHAFGQRERESDGRLSLDDPQLAFAPVDVVEHDRGNIARPETCRRSKDEHGEVAPPGWLAPVGGVQYSGDLIGGEARHQTHLGGDRKPEDLIATASQATGSG